MEAQEIFEAITDSAVLLDKSGRIINWNSGAASFFGYVKREAIGRSVNFLFDRNYPFPKLIQELSQQKSKWLEDTTYIRKNGIKGNCRTYLCPLPPKEESKATALMLHLNISDFKKQETDLTNERKKLNTILENTASGLWSATSLLIETMNLLEQTERKLRESELRFLLLAENATDLISRHTPDGTFLYVSPACHSATGYSPEELFNQSIYKLIHHDDHTKVKKAFTRKREKTNYKPVIYRMKRKEGEFRWFESNIRLIIDDQTRIISEIQLASRDVTDRVLDKKARLRGQQLAHVFRLSTMEEMASGMAHEISQPLAAIVNYTRGCARHLENENQDIDQLKSVMQKAVSQAERAGEIVHRLKNFFCKGQLVKTPCKINNVIRETIGLIKNELTTSKTKVEFDFDKNTPFIFIDKVQIQQVLLNLVQNAIEAMHQVSKNEKRIHIQTRKVNNDVIEITLHDNGPGFSKDAVNKVFMPFYTTKAHGRGMGLAICRSIVEAHGGMFTIYPNSSQRGGIRFSLPISI